MENRRQPSRSEGSSQQESRQSHSQPQSQAEERWAKIATPEKQARTITGVVRLAISLGLTPEQAGDLFSTLDDQTANGLAYGFSGVADGETVRQVGRELSKDTPGATTGTSKRQSSKKSTL
jgi:hypothetical protein